jgi:hypothetical protein
MENLGVWTSTTTSLTVKTGDLSWPYKMRCTVACNTHMSTDQRATKIIIENEKLTVRPSRISHHVLIMPSVGKPSLVHLILRIERHGGIIGTLINHLSKKNWVVLVATFKSLTLGWICKGSVGVISVSCKHTLHYIWLQVGTTFLLVSWRPPC